MSIATTRLPILESGDRLSREEFHRIYCLRPDLKKAELIQGVVYVPSPDRAGVHSFQWGLAALWLTLYAATVPALKVALNPTLFLDDQSEPQPDLCLCWDPWNGRGARLREDHYLEGAPEFVMEIAASSASYDLHDKKAMYQRAGVREYVVWRTIDGVIDWFRLERGAYVQIEPDEHGLIESAVFPGLRLPLAAMLAGDRTAILAALRDA